MSFSPPHRLAARCGRTLALARLACACALLWAGDLAAKPTPHAAPSTHAKRAVGAKPASKSAPKSALASKSAQPSKSAAPKPASPKRASEPVPAKEIPADVRALGPLSVGHPAAGYLINSVPMPTSPNWVLTAPDHAFATQETVDALSHCLDAVHARFGGVEPTRLGSISGVRGGRISPHKSHRTGRDADVYFFRTPGAKWSRAATEADIDLAPTWALLRCFVTDTDVDMILLDRRVQGWLEAYALANGESKEWVQSLFHDQREPRQMAVVRHEPGHVAHMHVRFSSPKARRAGVSAYDRLVAAGLVVPTVQSLSHQVKKGETLSGIARKFGVPVEKIKGMNGLRSNLIRVGQVLTLQHAVDILGARDAVGVPARRRSPTQPVAPQPVTRIAAKSPVPEQVTPDADAAQSLAALQTAQQPTPGAAGTTPAAPKTTAASPKTTAASPKTLPPKAAPPAQPVNTRETTSKVVPEAPNTVPQSPRPVPSAS